MEIKNRLLAISSKERLTKYCNEKKHSHGEYSFVKLQSMAEYKHQSGRGAKYLTLVHIGIQAEGRMRSSCRKHPSRPSDIH